MRAGRIEAAIAKCNREWASLPGSPYGQPTRTMAQALATYDAAGGMRAPVPLVQTDQSARQEAQTALDALRAWLEAAAAKGDTTAADMLRRSESILRMW